MTWLILSYLLVFIGGGSIGALAVILVQANKGE